MRLHRVAHSCACIGMLVSSYASKLLRSRGDVIARWQDDVVAAQGLWWAGAQLAK